MNSLTILVMGKGGVGKSSTVNSIVGERVVTISPFQVVFLLLFCLISLGLVWVWVFAFFNIVNALLFL